MAAITEGHVGRVVRVRQRQYLVDEVIPGPTGSTVVFLSCVDPDDLGRPLEVIWERELDAAIPLAENWKSLGTAQGEFDPADRFAAYYHTLRWNRLTASRLDLLQAPFRAGIGIEHYQLEPLRMALRMPRVNLFIADGVGLGKTIEAGLIARELILRRKVSDIVVCCPPSMVLQWREEMEGRFGLTFQIIDRHFVQRVRKERGFNVNPWATHNRFIISHNLFRDEDYAADLRTWLGRDLVRPRSLLILDEAHHAAPAAAGAFAVTSQFTRAVENLAPQFEHKLFLSATPHNGHPHSFQALMAVLDPQRFCRGIAVDRKLRDEVLIYRLKDDLRAINVAGFPERRVEPVMIDAPVRGTPELELAAKLDLYCTLREDRLGGAATRVRNASSLLRSGLQQRLLSSTEAFYRTLSKHHDAIEEALKRRETVGPVVAEMLDDHDDQALLAIGAGLDPDDDSDDLTDEAAPVDPAADDPSAEADRQTERATLATLGDTTLPGFTQETALLREMLAQAEQVRHQPDEKLKALFRYIDDQMLRPGSTPGWTEHRIIIFTEYDDSLRYIQGQLQGKLRDTNRGEDRLAVFRGQGKTSLDQRQAIREAFNADPAVHPVRILLATDAAREGLNLQKYCSNLFHYDIPWNPARLEQRNGRIDRKLQPAPVVHCRYFLYENREEDKILRRIVEKTETIYRELGGFSTVVDKALIQSLLKRGIERKQVAETTRMFDFRDPEDDQRAAQALADLSEDAEPRDVSATPDRRARIDEKRREKLRRSVERLRRIAEESRNWLEFRHEQFRAALNCSLRLMEIDGGLIPEEERSQARRYQLPVASLEQNPSWWETLNSLRAPRRRGESVGDWQARCPIRPVVFEDPGVPSGGGDKESPDLAAGRVEPVHLHLEHRVSQRLLGRLQSQGFVYNDLSRACLAQTAGSIPLVYLIGRLCLHGDHAARLHEDILAVCAEWVRPEVRRGPLVPIPARQMDQSEVFRRLDEALLRGDTARITPGTRAELLQAIPGDIDALKPHLEAQAARVEAQVRADLAATGQHEANAIRNLLLGQQRRIQDQLAGWDAEVAARQATAQAATARRRQTLLFADEDSPASDEERRFRREIRIEYQAMQNRAKAIPREIDEEPQRISDRYCVRAVRLEPVGIVYLWPTMG